MNYLFFSGKSRKRDIVGKVKENIAQQDTLYLIVIKEVWDRIVSGEKTIEYRERTDYWDKRIHNKEYSRVRITNGYGNKTRPYRIYKYTGATRVMKNSIQCYAIPIDETLLLESRDKKNDTDIVMHWHLNTE